jgi:hypothetical protein
MSEQWIRRGWRIGGSAVAVVMLVFGTAQSISALSHEERTTAETFDATSLRLVKIDNSAGGTVRVVGSDTDEVTVRTEVSDGLQKTRHREAIDGEMLVLESSCPFLTSFCEVRYVVEMPAGLAVTVWSPASVTVEDVTGDVTVDTDESIDAARLGGRFDARAVSGSINARDLRSSDVVAEMIAGSMVLDFAEAPLAVRAAATDGSIEVVVPEGSETYRVDARTVDGETSTQVDNGPAGDRTITATTTDGDIRIRYRT